MRTSGWLQDDFRMRAWLQHDFRMTSGLQGDFRMTSGWLQDDFRITSGWLQDDFRTDFSTGYCLLTLTSHLLIWSYFSQFNALNTTFIYHLCDLTFFHQLEILAIIGSTLMMVQYPKSADCNNTTTLHTLPILLSMSDWLSNWYHKDKSSYICNRTNLFHQRLITSHYFNYLITSKPINSLYRRR